MRGVRCVNRLNVCVRYVKKPSRGDVWFVRCDCQVHSPTLCRHRVISLRCWRYCGNVSRLAADLPLPFGSREVNFTKKSVVSRILPRAYSWEQLGRQTGHYRPTLGTSRWTLGLKEVRACRRDKPDAWGQTLEIFLGRSETTRDQYSLHRPQREVKTVLCRRSAGTSVSTNFLTNAHRNQIL